MKSEHSNYQLNFFTNNLDVTTTPTIIGSFLNSLSKFGLIPTFGQEINGATGERRQIMIMTNPEQTFKVEFPAHAIIISGININLDEFCSKVIGVMHALESLLPLKMANRLAFVSTYIYSGSKENYQDIYKKLFTYKTAEPFEWDNRIVQKISHENIDVKMNNVTTVKRCEIISPFIESGRPVDVIIFEVDINTDHEATSARYNWSNAIEIVETLTNLNKQQFHLLERYTK